VLELCKAFGADAFWSFSNATTGITGHRLSVCPMRLLLLSYLNSLQWQRNFPPVLQQNFSPLPRYCDYERTCWVLSSRNCGCRCDQKSDARFQSSEMSTDVNRCVRFPSTWVFQHIRVLDAFAGYLIYTAVLVLPSSNPAACRSLIDPCTFLRRSMILSLVRFKFRTSTHFV
jgi:hypothetical protein